MLIKIILHTNDVKCLTVEEIDQKIRALEEEKISRRVDRVLISQKKWLLEQYSFENTYGILFEEYKNIVSSIKEISYRIIIGEDSFSIVEGKGYVSHYIWYQDNIVDLNVRCFLKFLNSNIIGNSRISFLVKMFDNT